MKSLKILGFMFLFAIGASAATFVVNDPNDVVDATPGDGICATAGVVCTLRAAITESNALVGADIITLPAGTYTITIAEASDNVNANGDFDITTDIAINGAGSGSTFVEANAAPGVAIGRVFHIRGAAAANTIVASLDGMTIRNGRYANNTFGAGIRIDQGTNHSVTLNNVVVSGNLNASSGGGVTISGATTPTLTISNSTITGNGAGSAVAGTSANGAGIQVNAISTVNISNSTISNNASNNAIAASAASGFGGGIFIGGGTTTITTSLITGNTITISGAGATGSALAAGIYNQQATLSLTDSRVQNNTASNSITPAGSFHAGIRTLAGTIAATTTLTRCSVSGNVAGGDGGGVVNIPTSTANSTTNIIDSNVFGNTSTAGSGGGVLNSNGSTTTSAVGAVNITNSTVRNNLAAFGGGILNQISSATGVGAATITLTSSTVNANTSTGNGGGIYNISFATATGTATINSTNSTISGNRGASGGGITNENGAAAVGATSNLNYTTVASNTATASGGGLNQGGVGSTINLKNSIVADNTATTSGPDIFGTITSQDYNHVEDVTGGVFFASKSGKEVTSFFALPNDVTGSDPILGALALNGGTTQNHLPALLSPVLNTIPTGVSDCGVAVTTSQNGATRPQSVACDKGGAERLAPSAANASVRGRLISPFGRGLANAGVAITNTATGEIRYARSNQLGYFNFQDLAVGNVYVVEVNSKRFVFNSQSFTLNEDLTDLVLTAQ
jgi:Carboxypeptidase regulatory-like domain